MQTALKVIEDVIRENEQLIDELYKEASLKLQAAKIKGQP